MKISKKDALLWFEFFASLPEDEEEDVRTVYKAPKPHAEPRTRRND